MTIIYEDNHLVAVAKTCHEIVQGDKTGDEPLVETLKRHIKERDAKPGNVFLGVTHRLDRPTTGVVLFAKTSKALERLNAMFQRGEVHKTYWAIVARTPALAVTSDQAELTHWLTRNERQNRSYAHPHEVPGSKLARLRWRTASLGERYALIEVQLLTGRHHQIRCQLAAIGLPIRGDLKYGAPRSNPDGGISLHARRVELVHPVSKQTIVIEADPPQDALWQALSPQR